MHKKDLTSIGLMLPLYTIGIAALLISISFASSTISATIFIDKLILIAIGAMPLIFITGAIVCIYALSKPENRKTAAVGIILNLFLLAGQLYLFAQPFLMELKMLC